MTALSLQTVHGGECGPHLSDPGGPNSGARKVTPDAVADAPKYVYIALCQKRDSVGYRNYITGR